MSGSKYLVCSLQPHKDPLAKGMKIYVSKGINAYYMRIYLLPTGELVYVDYINYSNSALPGPVKSGICYGEGYPHYVMECIFHYRTLEDLQLDIPDIPAIKEELKSFSKAIIKMDDVTGCYMLVQGQELRDILSGEKGVR